LKFYDFGRSIFEGGTYYFKKQWGAKPIGLTYQCYNLSHDNFMSKIQSPITYKLFPKIWSKIPIIITNNIGPLIRKYIF